MISFQTNVNSLVAQENLRVNSAFQSNTIQQLTSGYRINQAGDDAAGLAVANKFRSDVAELTQGVRNANDGAGQLQIMDGGLNNISKILDRLKTLATESASSTFTGDRSTLNNEYQTLLGEVDRQASNIGLVNNGQFNKMLSVYLGGGSTQGNAQVTVDLSGTANQVDSGGLSLSSTDIQAGGTTLAGNVHQQSEQRRHHDPDLRRRRHPDFHDQLHRFVRRAVDTGRHRHLHRHCRYHGGRRGDPTEQSAQPDRTVGGGGSVGEPGIRRHRGLFRGERQRTGAPALAPGLVSAMLPARRRPTRPITTPLWLVPPICRPTLLPRSSRLPTAPSPRMSPWTRARPRPRP